MFLDSPERFHAEQPSNGDSETFRVGDRLLYGGPNFPQDVKTGVFREGESDDDAPPEIVHDSFYEDEILISNHFSCFKVHFFSYLLYRG